MKEVLRQYGGICIAAITLIAVMTIFGTLWKEKVNASSENQIAEASGNLEYNAPVEVPLQIFLQSVPAGEQIPIGRCFSVAGGEAEITDLQVLEEMIPSDAAFLEAETGESAAEGCLYFPKPGIYRCRLILRQPNGTGIPYEIRMIANLAEDREEKVGA